MNITFMKVQYKIFLFGEVRSKFETGGFPMINSYIFAAS